MSASVSSPPGRRGGSFLRWVGGGVLLLLALLAVAAWVQSSRSSAALDAYKLKVEAVASPCWHLLGPQWDAMPAAQKNACESNMRAVLNPGYTWGSVSNYAADLELETYAPRYPSHAKPSGSSQEDKADAAWVANVQTQLANQRMDAQDKANFQRESSGWFTGALLPSALVVAVSAFLMARFPALRDVLREVAILFFLLRPKKLNGRRDIVIHFFETPKERAAVRFMGMGVLVGAVICALWLVDGFIISHALRTDHFFSPHGPAATGVLLLSLGVGLAAPVVALVLMPQAVEMLFAVTRRVMEWEGPARFEQAFVDGERRWVRRGNPYGDPMVDDPRAASATGPAKPGFTKVFNDRTGEYEWVQSMAAKDGNPNVTPEATPFTPKGEYGDTPDVKPEGEFI